MVKTCWNPEIPTNQLTNHQHFQGVRCSHFPFAPPRLGSPYNGISGSCTSIQLMVLLSLLKEVIFPKNGLVHKKNPCWLKYSSNPQKIEHNLPFTISVGFEQSLFLLVIYFNSHTKRNPIGMEYQHISEPWVLGDWAFEPLNNKITIHRVWKPWFRWAWLAVHCRLWQVSLILRIGSRVSKKSPLCKCQRQGWTGWTPKLPASTKTCYVDCDRDTSKIPALANQGYFEDGNET